MFILDIVSLLMGAYLLVELLNVTRSILEKCALALLLALGIKSLFIFGLITSGIQPQISIQVLLSLLTLLSTVWFWWVKRKAGVPTSSHGSGKKISFHVVAAVFILAGLFVFGLANTWFFPITESDGISYHVKGLVYYGEVSFDPEEFRLQFRDYSPLVPLLFTYLISSGFETLKIIFPLFYLCLLAVFYVRVREHAGSAKVAATFAVILGTTPFIWWHSVLPFLNLTTGVFFSLGAIYWFFLVKGLLRSPWEPGNRSLALLSGIFFGFAAWTRLEFVLFGAIPILILAFVLRRNGDQARTRTNLIFLHLAVPTLSIPSLWILTLFTFEPPLFKNAWAVVWACLVLWLLVAVFIFWKGELDRKILIGTGIACGLAYAGLIVVAGPTTVSAGKAAWITLFRLVTVNMFYSFTVFVAILCVLERLRALPPADKLLGVFLIAFPLIHFAIFTFSNPKWSAWTEFLYATFIYPGNSVNLSDTRGLIALYPLLLFFISGFSIVRRSFEKEPAG